MDAIVQDALDEAENDAELYEKAADEAGVEFDGDDFVEVEVTDDSDAISPVDAEDVFGDDGEEDDAVTPADAEAAAWDDDDDLDPIVVEPAPTPKDRVIDAANDLQSAFGNLADVVVVASAPAVFVQPDAHAVLDETVIEQVADEYELDATRFNNREICFEA